MYAALSVSLTFLWQVILFGLCLHVFTPALNPLGVCVKQLHEPAPIPPQRGGRPARLARRGATLQRGRGFQLPGGLAGGLPGAWGFSRSTVILTIAEEPLGTYCSHCSILGGCAGLWVALEAPTKLQALVLHDRKALQLQVSLHSCSYTVWAFEPTLSEAENGRQIHLSTQVTMAKTGQNGLWTTGILLLMVRTNITAWGIIMSLKPLTYYLTLFCCPPLGSQRSGTPASPCFQILSLWLLQPNAKKWYKPKLLLIMWATISQKVYWFGTGQSTLAVQTLSQSKHCMIYGGGKGNKTRFFLQSISG